jgi:transcriptional regulator with XRE-family HTH domain
MTVGKKLKLLRAKKGLTQSQVADKLNISRGRYNSWENDIAFPRFEQLNDLSDFYNVSLTDLVGKDTESRGIPRDGDIDPKTRILAQDIQKLDKDQQKILESLIKSMREQRNKDIDE